MPKQLTEKEANQLLSQLQALSKQANAIKTNNSLKSSFDQIEKASAQLCKDNKDMPDA